MFTFGFYNSLDGDRKYNAEQFGKLFDGIIREGMLMHVGERMFVHADGGLGIRISPGRAWLRNPTHPSAMTWNDNDDNMFLTIASANNLGDRIDAVVLEADGRDESRLNSIRIIEGAPATASPTRPIMVNDGFVRQRPLAYVRVNRGVTTITQADITNMVGTSEFPFVTGPLETINADNLLAQWNTQWTQLFTNLSTQMSNQQTQWNTQMTNQQNQWLAQFNQQMETLNNQFMELVNLFHAMETGLFVLINNNFDDWSARRGTEVYIDFQPNGDILETMRIVATDFVMATRLTTFQPDGILEVVVFRPTSQDETFGETVRTIVTTASITTRFTRFLENGNIRQEISGEAVSTSLLDSNLLQLIDADQLKLLSWG